MDLANSIREQGGPGQGGERVFPLLVAEGDEGIRVIGFYRAKERRGVGKASWCPH